ncbi:MAG TPA: MFS transporter [Chthoniobacteraceae bacterium]|nr:MFS transporter [Chthoniobacteraceae bacterium]
MPSSRTSRTAISVAFLANGLLFGSWVSRIPALQERLALSESTLGFALLCLGGGALAAMLWTGWLLGRVESRKVIACGAMGASLLLLFPAWVPGPWSLSLVLALLGASVGVTDIAMNSQGAAHEERFHRPILSSLHGLWSAGGLIGAALGGLAAARAIPVGLHFAVAAVAAAGVTLAVYPWFLENRQEPGGEAPPGWQWPPVALAGLGVIAFSVFMAEGAIADWSALYLRDHLGTGDGFAASGYAAFSLCMAGVRFSGDWLRGRLPAQRLLVLAASLALAGMVLALLAGNAPGSVVGFALTGVGLASIFPTVVAIASRHPGISAHTGIAAVACAGYTGFLLGPAVIGFVAQAASLPVALGMVAGLCAVVIPLAFTVPRGGKRGAATAASSSRAPGDRTDRRP